MSDPRIVVVGGGLAGLSAALACADGGARVTLLEARPRLGGAATSFQRDGLWVDNGQHVFLRCCTAYREFLTRVGAESLTSMQDRLSIPVLSPDRGAALLRRTNLPAPLHLAGALARYRFLAPRDRWRVARAARRLARLDLDDPSLDERTFGEWLAGRRQSPQAIEALWNLVAVPALNLPAAAASLALAAKVFQTGLLAERDAADIGYAVAPLARIHHNAAARTLAALGADVRLGAKVERISVEPGASLGVDADGHRLDADAVVLAVPHPEAASLLPPGAHPEPARLAALGASPIVNVHVGYDRRVTDLDLAAGLDTPVQWVFDRTRGAGLADGQYLAISLSAADEWIGSRTEDLREIFLPALARLFPAAREAGVRFFFVTRERAATFRGAPGTRALRPGPTTRVPRLFLAGAWTDTGWPATMEGAVRSGLAAARAALIAVGRTRNLPAEAAA